MNMPIRGARFVRDFVFLNGVKEQYMSINVTTNIVDRPKDVYLIYERTSQEARQRGEPTTIHNTCGKTGHWAPLYRALYVYLCLNSSV
jgi:hypothetical protein